VTQRLSCALQSRKVFIDAPSRSCAPAGSIPPLTSTAAAVLGAAGFPRLQRLYKGVQIEVQEG
jgi:hypothetical protein